MRSEHALALALLALGCSAPRASDDASIAVPEPGVSGGPIAGHVEVITIDERTGAPAEASLDVILADGTPLYRWGLPPFLYDEPALVGPVSVSIRASSFERWIGVDGARIVIPVRSGRFGTSFFVRARGVSTTDGSTMIASALLPFRVLRPDTELGTAIPGAVEASGVRRFDFELAREPGPVDVVLLLRDASGRPTAFGIVENAFDGGANAVDLSDPSRRLPAVTVPLALPSAPPGLDAVVGVPGLELDGAVAQLAAPVSEPGEVAVPVIGGPIEGGSVWLIARATSSLDRTIRSVVAQRGIASPSDVGGWPPFLPVPSAEIDGDGQVTLAPVEGATVFVVEWLEPDCPSCGGAGTSALVLDPTRPVPGASGPTNAPLVRIRAIDAGPIDPREVSLAQIERTATRWSEITIDRMLPR